MTRISVDTRILRWAIERSGLPSEMLERKFPKMQAWITGEIQPTLRQLEGLANATMTPFGYMFLSAPPTEMLPIPLFRTLADEPVERATPDLLETVHSMERRQAWMREFAIEQGQDSLDFVQSISTAESEVDVAKRIRSALGVSDGWAAKQPSWQSALDSLRDMIEGAGIFVVVNGIVGNNTHRKLNPTEFRGFVLVDEYAPLMFINGADGKAAQMFTLAHELAHIWFGSSAAFDLREMRPANDPTERACNSIAAEFLVPAAELGKVWPTIAKNPARHKYLARHFKVSEVVAARRMLDLQLISKKEFFEFYNSYLSEEREISEKKGEGGNFFALQRLRIGERFATTVIRAAREGKLLYADAYRLTGLNGQAFEKFAASLGIGVNK